ncbi:hypothetical protein GLOIN_2v1777970 [Rhizophagus clarus]|uniref:Uncharacterized protein n=1 Tax=Rhizophagus clarus TaxID=94130 RepID=A0A8H3LJF1_9GLOM|nr:hypothetical protein GLOIN_2v1777970 [Rhizophagus clarus]
MWAEYIENFSKLYNSMFFMVKNFISPQSFKIFTNLAKSLILLIISHRKFYPRYPLYPWEYGYVFDFDPNFKSNENIDILCTWLDDSAIHDAIKIAYDEAAKFIKVLGIKLLNDKSIPHFYGSTTRQLTAISNLINIGSDDPNDINDISGFEFNNDEPDLDEDFYLTNAASEVAKLSQLADLEQKSNELEQEHKLSDSSKVELDYILNNSKKYFSVIELEQNELFYVDGLMNILQIIQTRASHNAFSRFERPCQNRQLNTTQSFNNQTKLKQNSANLLISEFFRNENTFESSVRSRKERWIGRKKLENIGLPQHIKASNIFYANITDNNPLQENNFILYISKEEIFLGKVLSMYRLVSNRHAYIPFLKDVDSLSYISVTTFINIDGNLFSPISKAGGNLFAHITPKQVIYHFDNNNLDIICTNLMDIDNMICQAL